MPPKLEYTETHICTFFSAYFDKSTWSLLQIKISSTWAIFYVTENKLQFQIEVILALNATSHPWWSWFLCLKKNCLLIELKSFLFPHDSSYQNQLSSINDISKRVGKGIKCVKMCQESSKFIGIINLRFITKQCWLNPIDFQ